jgi:hypothetical protein
MAIDFAFAEPDEADADPSPWQPMATAPQSILHPVLLRSKWAGRPVALVGVWMRAHGAFCTQPIFGQGEQIIYADGWCEIPDLGDQSR